MRSQIVIASMALMLGACTQPPASSDSQAKAAGAGEPAAELAQPLVVSTNEPFWGFAITGKAVEFSGLGVDPGRRLEVIEDQVSDTTRHLVATDAGGRVELQVRLEPCADSMSGAAFPYWAQASVDGAPAVQGCARPASMPPPGEPGA